VIAIPRARARSQNAGRNVAAEGLADRPLALTVAGHLTVTDPAVAAEQFGSLLTGGMDARTRFGTRPLPEAELREVARATVDTFVRAFAPA
jgi:TetR/AcrR family transcriptional repressor of mexJK operon